MKKLRFKPHAEMRMRERNITEAEVRETLEQPKDKHFFNPIHGTMNVRHTFPNLGMTVLVGHEERAEEIVIVTVIEE